MAQQTADAKAPYDSCGDRRTTGTRPTAASVGSFEYQPALDGLRGVAVLAVMAYHAGIAWIGGGLLGVDVFFVLSGYLVTSLLLAEHARSAKVNFRRFWARRARRLAPGLAVLLFGVSVYVEWSGASISQSRLRGDAVATLLYFANWHFIASSQNYFVYYGTPSPLLHTWSLAVEEQFYLVWPAVTLFVALRWGRRRLGQVALSAALLSAGLCAGLYLHRVSVDRLYYGTDTRAQALMVGAGLAVFLKPRLTAAPRHTPLPWIAGKDIGARISATHAGHRIAVKHAGGHRIAVKHAGGHRIAVKHAGGHRIVSGRLGTRPTLIARATGLLGVTAATVLGWFLHAVDGTGPFLYLGGFLVVSLATASLIAVTVQQPTAVVARALCWRPLRGIGRISYGLYLYHWPLFLAITPSSTGISGYSLLAIRFSATFAAAILSYHLLEAPIRAGVFPHLRLSRGKTGKSSQGVAVAAVGGLLVGALLASIDPHSPAGIASIDPHSPGGIASSDPASNPLASNPLASNPPLGYVAPGGATAAHPVRALLVGDSMAVTLGEGLGIDSDAWGVSLDNMSALGCDLDPQTTVNVMGVISKAAQGCPNWRTTWSRLVAATNPDVVVVLLGRWETIDRLWAGKWTTVGQPAFDAHLRSELNQIVTIGSERGARVVFLTLPYIRQKTVQPNGQPWDMNLPSRTNSYNADIASVVASNRSKAALIDLNTILDPAGHYTSWLDGIRVRASDDEHISVAGGEWLRPRLLPLIAAAAPNGR